MWYKIDIFWELLDNEFPDYKDEIKKRYEELKELKRVEKDKSNENTKMQEAYNLLTQEFDKDNNFVRRMKLLCDTYFQYPDFFRAYSSSPLQYVIPIEYQNYINLLGFEKIKALEYRENNIITYIQSQQNLQNSSITSLK